MKHTTHQSGFSLIELLVSLTLFMAVITMGVGTLLVLIDANSRAQNMQEVMTNLTFALDSMTREIRTGRGYFCETDPNTGRGEDATQDCTGGRGISIVEGGESLTEGTGSSRIGYRLSGSRIERKVGDGAWQPLTSDMVTIDAMHFTVRNTATFLENGDRLPPYVTIFIEGSAGELASVDTSFSVQTTVTKRLLDI